MKRVLGFIFGYCTSTLIHTNFEHKQLLNFNIPLQNYGTLKFSMEIPYKLKESNSVADKQ